MAHMPSLLREPLKLLIQYLAVAFASIPAGIVYVLCLRLIGNQKVSLVIALSIGILSAQLVWRALDKRILLSRPFAAPLVEVLPHASLVVVHPERATEFDKLFDQLISTELGISPEEVTAEYMSDWRERELYPRAGLDLGTIQGAYKIWGKQVMTRAETTALHKKAEAFLNSVSFATSESRS